MKLKIAVISDVHLGHLRNEAKYILNNLDNNFLGHPDVKDAQIIFIAGDLFDRLLEPTSPDKPIIYMWFIRLCLFCSKNNIALRILEGTPSHDWKQSEILPTIKDISSLDLDFKYVKTLSIEYFDKFGINVLYVPDEWRPKTEETLEQVHDLMKSKGLETVDFAIMHGNFEYQLPSHIRGIPRHSSEEYLKIVTEYVFIGHIHTHSRFNRIIAQGSFDRLSHGEEEPKGFMIADVDIGKNDRNAYFIENKGARIHKTIDCTDMDLQETIEHITRIVTDLPGDAFVRIQAQDKHPLFSDMDVLLKICPTITWSKKAIVEEKTQLIRVDESVDEIYKAVTLTKENLAPILFARPAFKNISVDMLERSKRHLQEAL